MNRSDSGMGKFDLGLWVSAILLVIAVVLTILLVRGKSGFHDASSRLTADLGRRCAGVWPLQCGAPSEEHEIPA